MSKEFADYPKGRFAVGGGDLNDAYDIALMLEDGETVVSTIRKNPAGSTGGKRKAEVTFKSAISEDGFERDYMANYQKRKVIQGRLKVPGKTFVIEGRFSQPQINSNVDNFVDFSIKLVGKLKSAT